MRTPGHDYELAVGFCHTEGLLAGAPVTEVRYCATGSAVDTEFNVVSVDTGGAAPAPTPAARQRPRRLVRPLRFARRSTTLGDRLAPLAPSPSTLAVLARSSAWSATGAGRAGRCSTGPAACTPRPRSTSTTGEVLVAREDIGRHNAVDKVVGRLLLDGALPATGLGLWVSGRASFEMVQKAWAGRLRRVLASVSAASGLAVETARRANSCSPGSPATADS